MVALKTPEVKKLLLSHGFLVYRTRDAQVFLAERVRENLIMDAHVRVQVGPEFRVRFTVRAQRSDFPSSSETDEHMFARARAMAEPGLTQGFEEVGTEVMPISAPMDPSKLLDTWYQVSYEKQTAGVEEMIGLVRFALALEKVAPR